MTRPALLSAAALGLCACAADIPPDEPLRFTFPLAERERILTTTMGVDHDGATFEGVQRFRCSDYQGRAFPWCYDRHDGTDFDLDGGFEAMDAGSVEVLAAAWGRVVLAEDGNYDRCRLDPATFEATCDGNPMRANRVHVEHADGTVTRYHHLQRDSVEVHLGQWVGPGEVLGRVGSSGWSTAPHLHFEVVAPDGRGVDPFAGPLSQSKSWWCEQDGGDGLPGGC